MILLDDISPIGAVGKTHGIKGDMNIALDTDFDFEGCDYIVLDIDGIFVPFFIEEYRYRSNTTVILHLEDIDTEPHARQLYNKTVYVDKELVVRDDEGEPTAEYYVGYTLLDNEGNDIGQITSVDNSTDNTLFLIGETLIPVAAIEVIELDEAERRMTVSLPEGLLDL